MKLGEPMPDESHKGKKCPYSNKPLTCQENYCKICLIFEKWAKGLWG